MSHIGRNSCTDRTQKRVGLLDLKRNAQYAEIASALTGLEKEQSGVFFFSWSLLRLDCVWSAIPRSVDKQWPPTTESQT